MSIESVRKSGMFEATLDAFKARWEMNPVSLSTFVWLTALAIIPLWKLVESFYWPAGNGVDITQHPIGRDFINVWSGPQLAFSGQLQTLFDLKGYHDAIGQLFGYPLPFHNWSYPLHSLFFYWPMAQLPYFWGLAVWTIGLGVAILLVALAPVPREHRVVATILLLIAPAWVINAIGGQNGFMSGALFLGGILLLDRRPLTAGVLFGLLTFKPHLGVVLPFALIALGAWRAITSAIVTTAALVLVSVFVFGFEAWKNYFDVVGGYQTLLLKEFRGFYVVMMTSVLTGARSIGIPYGPSLIIQVIVAVGVIAVACRLVRQTSDPCERSLVLALATLLATPYAFNYDMTALAVVLVWMLVGRLPRVEFSRQLMLLLWATPALMMPIGLILHGKIGFAPIITSVVVMVAFIQTARAISKLSKSQTDLPIASAPIRAESIPRLEASIPLIR